MGQIPAVPYFHSRENIHKNVIPFLKMYSMWLVIRDYHGMTNPWVSVVGTLGVGVWVGHIIPDTNLYPYHG